MNISCCQVIAANFIFFADNTALIIRAQIVYTAGHYKEHAVSE